MLGETQYNIIQHNTVILQNTNIENNDRIAVMIWWYYNWIHNDGCMSECMMTFQNHKRKTTWLPLDIWWAERWNTKDQSDD